MAKTKTKAWVKGLIAVAVIAVVGVLGYYGANGELFQGKLKLDRANFDKVRQTNDFDKVRMDRVNRVAQPIEVDGVNDSLLKEVAVEKVAIDSAESYDKVVIDTVDKVAIDYDNVAIDNVAIDKIDMDYDNVAIDNVAIDKVAIDKVAIDNVAYDDLDGVKYNVLLPTTADLEVGTIDEMLIKIKVENNNIDNVFVNQITLFEDGGGLDNYEWIVSGVELSSSIEIETEFIESLNKNVRKITFNFDAPYEISANSSNTFDLRASVLGGESFVSYSLDSIATDHGLQVNTDYDFAAFSRDVVSMFR